MELDANLFNGDAFLESVFQYLVLETLNINFQQVDGIVPVHLHLTHKTGAGEGFVPAGLQPGTRGRPTPDCELCGGGRSEAYGLKEETVIIREADRTCSNWSGIEYVDLDPKPSDQLLLESDIFADAAAVDHGIGAQATCHNRPLGQDPYSLFVR